MNNTKSPTWRNALLKNAWISALLAKIAMNIYEFLFVEKGQDIEYLLIVMLNNKHIEMWGFVGNEEGFQQFKKRILGVVIYSGTLSALSTQIVAAHARRMAS